MKDNKAKIEFIARITTADGRVIETTAEAPEGIPDLTDFDLSTEEGFLRDFDSLEQGLLAAGRQVEKQLASEYLEEASKKNRSDKQKK